MSKDKDRELEEIFTYGMDRRARRIYFGLHPVEEDEAAGDVGWASVEQAIRNMHLLVRDSATKPIELHAYSWGGDVYAMLRMIDEIEACPCQIKFFGGGRIASAMTWIMAVCDERNLHKNTQVMLHDGSDGMDGKHTDVQIDARHGRDIQDRLDQIFVDNSIMPLDFWQDILQRDLFVSAEECIELGLADKIIPQKKRGNLRRSRIAIHSGEVDLREMRKLTKSLYDRINRKRTNKIEIHAPKKEQFDSSIYVEEHIIPEVEDNVEPLIKTKNQTDENE